MSSRANAGAVCAEPIGGAAADADLLIPLKDTLSKYPKELNCFSHSVP